MDGAVVILVAAAVLLIAFHTYGNYVACRLGVDPLHPTPAHTRRDGADYVPTPSLVLAGHHFASIAGAAPIVGPIAAAAFGWLPALLWVVLGSIFAGAVHDFASLVASVRHDGKSIGEVIGENLGPAGRPLFLAFAWLALVLLIAAFANVVAGTLAAMPQAATAVALFPPLAAAFGAVARRAPLGIGPYLLLGAALLASLVGVGHLFPLAQTAHFWEAALLLYVLLASQAPVWLLLQPRDFLNSILLHCALGAALLGIIVANPRFELPAFTALDIPQAGYLFPMLFVTVACGAISGFHSLVASGTTSKLLKSEGHAKRIGYGAMLVESLLAVTAIVTVAALSPARYQEVLAAEGPLAVYGRGIAGFIAHLGLPVAVGQTLFGFGVSALALTLLDTAARLGRYTLQELSACPGFARLPGMGNRYFASTFTLAIAGVLLYSEHFALLWPIFGAANQLLASLALLAVAVWLARQRRGNRFLLYPLAFMLAVTLTALASLFFDRLLVGSWRLALLCALLFALALILVGMAHQALAQADAKDRERAPES